MEIKENLARQIVEQLHASNQLIEEYKKSYKAPTRQKYKELDKQIRDNKDLLLKLKLYRIMDNK